MKEYKFYALSFLTGFVLMLLEITASRLAAPIVGTSVYTWTTIIGVILLALSMGNIIGGKLADKFGSKEILSLFFLFCAISIAIIPFLAKLTPQFVSISESLVGAIFIVSFLLFFTPSLLLGTIFPFILKLSTQNINTIGEVVGYLSAFSAFGSIAGTFLTGFFFIGFIGTFKTILILASLFFLSSTILIVSQKKWLKNGFFLALATAIPFAIVAQSTNQNKHIIYQIESDYYNIKVVEDSNLMGGAKIMFLDEGSHSVELINSTELIAPYNKIISQTIRNIGNNDKILMIGGGSYSLAKDLKKNTPMAEIDAIEIDPAVQKTAENFFNLNSNEINTIVGDARLLLKNDHKYSVIINDTYNNTVSVPWHLTTQNFLEDVDKNLNENGIYIANLISSLQEDEAIFLKSYYKTLKSVFPETYAIKTEPFTPANNAQNITFISFKNTDSMKIKSLLADYYILNIDNMEMKDTIILTDNFAPVERMMSPIIDKYYKYYLENILFKYLL